MSEKKTYTARCSHGGCAHIEQADGGVTITSTLGADRGRLFLDDAEFAQLVTDVKAGAVDHLLAVTV